MDKKHLMEFEVIIPDYDKFSQDGYDQVILGLRNLRLKDIIDYSIQVPVPRNYQIFIYFDESREGMLDVIKLFVENKVYFRYRELM
jgi:hypothetical protein